MRQRYYRTGQLTKTKRVSGAIAVLAMVSVTMAACGSGASLASTKPHGRSASRAPSAVTVKFQVYQGNLVNLVTYVATEEGFFKKNGIKAQLVPIGSSVAGAAALTAGSIDVLSASPDAVLPLVAKGLTAKVIAGQTKQIFELIINKKDKVRGKYPRDLSVLKGKTVGVTALGAASQALVEAMLKQAGIPATDVTFVPVGAAASAVAAFTQGKVDALSYYAPTTTVPVLNGQAVVLANPAKPGDGPPGIAGADYVAEWVTGSYLASHKSTVARIRKAMAEASVWMHQAANLPRVTKVVRSIVGSAVPTSDLASFTKQNLVTYDTAAYSKTSLRFWDQFDTKYNFISSEVPLSQIYAPGTPANLAAERSMAGGK